MAWARDVPGSLGKVFRGLPELSDLIRAEHVLHYEIAIRPIECDILHADRRPNS